jgi:hypothetical protein
MPSLLIIRLHPEAPVTGDEFSNYLKGLSIAVHGLAFSDPDGDAPAFATAAYVAPKSPASPSKDPAPVPNVESRITQHFEIIPDAKQKEFTRNFFAVATAVIEIPKDYPWISEYRAIDVRLVITRDGNEIVHKQFYYNLPLAPVALPKNPNEFPKLEPISLHLALPAPGQQLTTIAGEPADVALPDFASVREAMESVLRAEAGTDTESGLAGIANLTREQCRHIAFEITWDPTRYPLPVPPRPLEVIYTGPQSADSDDERDRRNFENALVAHYSRLNSQAEHLTSFVFAVSAAIWCEQETKKATRAGFSFPVFPAAPAQEAKVILNGGDTPLGFDVPAEYFYAVTAILPLQVMREERFQMTVLSPEEQTVANIKRALNQHLITERTEVNRYQAARRLRALGSVDAAGNPEFVFVRSTALTGKFAPAQRLVGDWLRFPEADLIPFWRALPSPDLRGHLDLLLTVITKAQALLMAAITGPEFGVKDVNGLADKTTGDWEELLNSNPNLLPEFTLPGTTEERTQTFIRYLGKFFVVPKVYEPSPAPTPVPAPAIDHPPGNPLDALLANYQGFSFDQWDPGKLAEILRGIFTTTRQSRSNLPSG